MPDPKESTKPALAVVMPYYHEEASIERTLREWTKTLQQAVGNDYVILCVDDHGTDWTTQIITELRGELPNIEILRNPQNLGHGQSCLRGYRIAAELEIPWILQIDSDGQCDPQYFEAMWVLKEKSDITQGLRTQRLDGNHRWLASRVLEFVVKISTGVETPDPNCPYRLMRTDTILPFVRKVSPNFHLANIALAILLKAQEEKKSPKGLTKRPGIKHSYTPITFRERHGGKPSGNNWALVKKLIQLHFQAKTLPLS